jgi:hypothetical protein
MKKMRDNTKNQLTLLASCIEMSKKWYLFKKNLNRFIKSAVAMNTIDVSAIKTKSAVLGGFSKSVQSFILGLLKPLYGHNLNDYNHIVKEWVN